MITVYSTKVDGLAKSLNFPVKVIPEKAGNHSNTMSVGAFCPHAVNPKLGRKGGGRKEI
jgi:hypothetical protein